MNRSKMGLINWMLVIGTAAGWSGVMSEICYGPVCYYELNVGLSQTMRDSELHQIVLSGTQLQFAEDNGQVFDVPPDNVTVADGFVRDVILFNGQLPGPTIEVMQGVKLVIKMNNQLRQKAVAIHWHGIKQYNTYYMDGSDGITQCPVLPGMSFTYQFEASPAGTHWYHSHFSTMRLDGLFGLLIVHRVPPKIPYISLTIMDWNHVTSEDLELTMDDLCENGAVSPPMKSMVNQTHIDCSFDGAEIEADHYTSSLFDGRNRWENQPFPLKEYLVQPGQRYRVRMVNTGHVFPFQISVDQHPLTIVGSEGSDVHPIPVDYFFIFVAESIDFEFVADQIPGRYWFRAETQCSGAFARGIIVYKGFENDRSDPSSEPRNCTSDSPCTVFNCPFKNYPLNSNRSCIPIVEAQSTLTPFKLASTFGLGDSSAVVNELFMNFGMNAGPSINGRRFMMPKVALFQNRSAVSDCVGEPCADGCSCRCTPIVVLPFGETIRIVISNIQPNPMVVQDMYHTAHLHGHEFAVLAEEFPESDPFTGHKLRDNSDVECDSDLCAHPHWSGAAPNFSHINNSVIKDSVVIPIGGYVVIQFVANNPGYWMFHCHIDMHLISGMGLIFKVSHPVFGLPKLPPRFPECHDFPPCG